MDDPMSLTAEFVEFVIQSLAKGRVTPFLGAGANMAGRPPGFEWSPGCGFLPNSGELASHLAEWSAAPVERPGDLMEVVAYVEGLLGRGSLYEELHEVFDSDTPPSSVHVFFAQFMELAHDSGSSPNTLFVTTNYDDALERALQSSGQDFDVVAYLAEGERRGVFAHRPPGGEPVLIEDAKTYDRIPLDERPAILKIHGSIDRWNPDWDSFVITEEQYVEYLLGDVWEKIPITIVARLHKSHLLFLGYSMRDWNLLVVLTRLGVLPAKSKSWAIQRNPTFVDEQRWQRREIEMFNVPLERFVDALNAEVTELRQSPPGA
jgi:SIR2-like domain